MRLGGERLALRPLAADDLDAAYRALQEPGVARWWTAFDAERIREELLATPETTSFAIEVDGKFAGVVMYSEELDPDYRHAGIDIFLAGAYQDQGYGSEAIRALARYLFGERGHHRLTIDPALANERAIRAYERVGFRRVGVMREYERGADGTWHDGLLMDLLAREFEPRIRLSP
jgi:aminoglycoside 6'-N-acetyltransferase